MYKRNGKLLTEVEFEQHVRNKAVETPYGESRRYAPTDETNQLGDIWLD